MPPCLVSRTKPTLDGIAQEETCLRSLGGSRPGPLVLCPVPAPGSHFALTWTPSSHLSTCCAVAPPSCSSSQATSQQLSRLWLPPSRSLLPAASLPWPPSRSLPLRQLLHPPVFPGPRTQLVVVVEVTELSLSLVRLSLLHICPEGHDLWRERKQVSPYPGGSVVSPAGRHQDSLGRRAGAAGPPQAEVCLWKGS